MAFAGVKFCGLCRSEDVEYAAELGAQYVGFVFAGGPRSLTDAAADLLIAGAPPGPRRVGVMSGVDFATMAERGRRLGLDIIQLHSDPGVEDVRKLRAHWSGAVWAVVRGRHILDRARSMALAGVCDALLLDGGRIGELGGRGESFDWERARSAVPDGVVIGLAGGLHAGNVAEAIRVLGPSFVDVSSGVEEEPGRKDRGRMRDFVAAVRRVGDGDEE